MLTEPVSSEAGILTDGLRAHHSAKKGDSVFTGPCCFLKQFLRSMTMASRQALLFVPQKVQMEVQRVTDIEERKKNGEGEETTPAEAGWRAGVTGR